MAPKLISLPFSCIFLSFSLLPLLSLSHSQPQVGNVITNITNNIPSAFEFLHHLQGCHKGEKIKGLHELKQYLSHFGYLNYQHSENHTQAEADVFDHQLEAAIKTYQLNYHLKPTGTLDAPTVSKMIMPRCGKPDIVNGTNTMRNRKNRHQHQHGPNSFHTISHYSFFPGSPRWPAGKTQLTYGFLSGFPTQAMNPVALAFNKWASASQYFTFSMTQDLTNADIRISFGRGDHGDGSPFDGPGGVLAHAFSPPDGRFHYDADDTWSIGPVPNAYDLETLALHEIGHLLGLDHSQVEDAIMWGSFVSGVTKGLHGDDIQGIRDLYNVN